MWWTLVELTAAGWRCEPARTPDAGEPGEAAGRDRRCGGRRARRGVGLWATDGEGDGGPAGSAARSSPGGGRAQPQPLLRAVEGAAHHTRRTRTHRARAPAGSRRRRTASTRRRRRARRRGRLIAGELGLTYAGEKDDERAGDVVLDVKEDKGAGSESYTMTVRDGRVTVTGPAEAGVYYGTRTLKQAVDGGGTAPEGVVQDEPANPRQRLQPRHRAQALRRRLDQGPDTRAGRPGSSTSWACTSPTTRPSASSPTCTPRSFPTTTSTKAEGVKEIIDLAASRHITVVPEIDSLDTWVPCSPPTPTSSCATPRARPSRGAIDISRPRPPRSSTTC